MSQATPPPHDHPSSPPVDTWRPATEAGDDAGTSAWRRENHETAIDEPETTLLEPEQAREPASAETPGTSGEQAIPRPSLRAVYAEALESAITLAIADGGELATISNDGQRMVARVRYQRAHASSGAYPPSGKGTPSRPSQPAWAHSSSQTNETWRPGMVFAASHPSMPDDATEVERQSTQVLPLAKMRPAERAFGRGEGFIGLAWHEGKILVMQGTDYLDLQRAAAAFDEPDWLTAAWRIAIPIFRPSALNGPLTGRPPSDVIGVLSLYRNDPNRSFTQRELEVMPLHADRIARALRQVEVAHQYQSQVELLESFHDIGVNLKKLPDFFARVCDIIRHLVDAPTFGVLQLQHSGDVTLEYAEHNGQILPIQSVPAVKEQPWWKATQAGRTIILPTAPGATNITSAARRPLDRRRQTGQPAQQEESASPRLGWGDETPAQSLLAAPLLKIG